MIFNTIRSVFVQHVQLQIAAFFLSDYPDTAEGAFCYHSIIPGKGVYQIGADAIDHRLIVAAKVFHKGSCSKRKCQFNKLVPAHREPVFLQQFLQSFLKAAGVDRNALIEQEVRPIFRDTFRHLERSPAYSDLLDAVVHAIGVEILDVPLIPVEPFIHL